MLSGSLYNKFLSWNCSPGKETLVLLWDLTRGIHVGSKLVNLIIYKLKLNFWLEVSWFVVLTQLGNSFYSSEFPKPRKKIRTCLQLPQRRGESFLLVQKGQCGGGWGSSRGWVVGDAGWFERSQQIQSICIPVVYSGYYNHSLYMLFLLLFGCLGSTCDRQGDHELFGYCCQVCKFLSWWFK